MKNGLIINSDGTKMWYLNDLHHRIDGPAIEWASGSKEWILYGFYHREDGPALEYGDEYKYWYLHGKRVNCNTNEEFLRIVKLRAFW